MQDDYTTLEDVVRAQYANVFWTHKIQEKQAEIYEFRHKLFSWINIISASLTSAGIISIVFVDQFWIKLVSAIVSFVTTTMSALLATFDYKNLAKSNKTAATKLVCYRNELLSLLGRIRIKEICKAVYTKHIRTLQIQLIVQLQRQEKLSMKVKMAHTLTKKLIDFYLIH